MNDTHVIIISSFLFLVQSQEQHGMNIKCQDLIAWSLPTKEKKNSDEYTKLGIYASF